MRSSSEREMKPESRLLGAGTNGETGVFRTNRVRAGRARWPNGENTDMNVQRSARILSSG